MILLRRLASYAERIDLPSSFATPRVLSLESVARRFALVALALIYSGAERYLASVSKPLHYGFDVVLLAAIAMLLIAARSRAALRIVPYALWICIYYAWGVAVAPDRSAVWSAAASAVILNGLILSTVALSVSSRSDLSVLAAYVQLAVCANLLVALLQAIDWHVLAAMAQLLNSTTYNIYRPAGMWIDPNVAGISYLFGFLLSLFVPNRRAALLGRAAATAGILLTGSREAMYPLLLSWGIVILLAAHRQRSLWGRLVSLASRGRVVAGIAAIALVAALLAWLSPMREAIGYNVHRFLDASARGPAEPSRLQLATYWFNRAIHDPWYGTGVFSFQGNGRTVFGAHNIYLTTWGEVGIPLLIVYLTVLAIGVMWLVQATISLSDRATLGMMWIAYLILGFTWHNQFSSVESIVVIGILYVGPAALTISRSTTAEPMRETIQNPARASSGHL